MQSVQEASVAFGLQTAAHDEPSSPASLAPEVAPPSSIPLDIPELVDPLDIPELVDPLDAPDTADPLDAPDTADPLDAPDTVDPLDIPEPVDPPDVPEVVDPLDAPEPADPLDAPDPADPVEPPPLSSHAASPTVADAPATTTAWKSFSIFMTHTAWLEDWADASRRRRRGGYCRPRPMQHGSLPQMGVPIAQVSPTGSQQQQPLQSVQVAIDVLGLQTDPHDEPPPLFEPPPGLPPPLLPQAASPAVVDAPVTTRTWKSFATFIVHHYMHQSSIGNG